MTAGDGAEVGYTKVDHAVLFGETVHRSQLLVRRDNADLQTRDLAEPALLPGLGDASREIVNDLAQAGRLRGVLDVQPNEGTTSVRVDCTDTSARPKRTARWHRALPPGRQ